MSWLVNYCNSSVAEIIPVQFSAPMESAKSRIAKGGQNHTTARTGITTSKIKEGFISGAVRFHPSASCD